MNKDSYTPCTKCGRPMRYCKGECCGKKPEGCDCREYGCKHNACIREKNPDCPYEAVIPSVTVETINNLKDLADCFVHVEDINTTFYIDDKHRIMVTWAGLVSADDYDFDTNPLNVRSQIIYDAKNNKAAIYDNKGAHYIFQISDIENDYMLLENKPAINGVTLEGDKSLKELDIVATFDTVADMKAATSLVDGATVRTLGFYAVGDGGGATYKITNAGTANEMDIIAIGHLYAEMVKCGDTYAEQFGIKHEAGFDNKTILDYALSQVSKLRFCSYEYYVSGALTLHSNNKLVGNDTKLYSDSPYILKGNSISNILISGIEFESTVDTSDTVNMNETNPNPQGYTTLSSIINIRSSSDITIEKCKVHGSFTGIFIQLSTNVLVRNNECYDASSKIVCLSSSNFRLMNNYIHDVRIHANDAYPCYLFQATDTKTVKYQEASVIDGNKMVGNANWDAIMCHQYNGMVITNNYIKDVRTGIDLSLVSSDTMNGNTIISDNYMEQCTEDRWPTPAIDHALFVRGDGTNNENVIINGNIFKDFGKFNSPSGGCIVLIGDADNITMTGNIVIFNETLNSIHGALMLGGTLRNLNITDNTILASNLTCICFNTTTITNTNITGNILVTSRATAIDNYSTVELINCKVDNTFNCSYQLEMRNGNKLNGRTYGADNVRPIFSTVERYNVSINTFTVAANSYVRKFLNKATDLGITDTSYVFDSHSVFNIAPNTGSFPNAGSVVATYGDSSNLKVCFFNHSDSTITIPTTTYDIRIEK